MAVAVGVLVVVHETVHVPHRDARIDRPVLDEEMVMRREECQAAIGGYGKVTREKRISIG